MLFFGVSFQDISPDIYAGECIRFDSTSELITTKRRIYEPREHDAEITSIHCPKCDSSNIIFWGTCSKTMYDKYRKAVSVDGIRILCKSCNKTTCRYPQGIELWQRLLPETKNHLVTQKMFKKSGYRDIGREDYTKSGFSASTCWNTIQELGPEAKKALSGISKGWSSTLIVDEKYEKCKGGTIMWIVAGQFFRDKNGHHYCCIIKTKTFYIAATEESRKDKRKLKKDVRELLAKENPRFFHELADEIDHPENIKVIVTDLENTYPDAIAKAFPNARHQFCLQHAVESLKRIFDLSFHF